MNPVVYQFAGILGAADSYLPGQYRWPFPVRLTRALLDVAEAPTAGSLTLSAEIGGLSGVVVTVFTVSPAVGHVVLERDLTAVVPANTWVRFRAEFSGAPETGPRALSVTLHAVPVSVPRPVLTLQWVNGIERLILFNYDAETHTWTETQPGIATGRAVLTQTGDTLFSLSLQATELFRVASETLSLEELIESRTPVENPRLIFFAGNIPFGRLTASGFYVPRFTEEEPEALSPGDVDFYNRFEFYSAGQLTAVLGASGLTAVNLVEPMP